MPPILFSVGTHECLIQILGASFTTTISVYTEKCTAYIADIFNSYGRPLDDHWSSVHMVTGWKLAVMFASYGGRLEARGLNDLIVYGRQYTLFITTSQVFSE